MKLQEAIEKIGPLDEKAMECAKKHWDSIAPVSYTHLDVYKRQVLEVMIAAEQEGKAIVRLHTGDPCLYGAIREQMDCLLYTSRCV